MLVLSRKKSERIHIGENITLTICEIRAESVRIGIDAPKDMKIHRDEVQRRIQGEQGDKDEPR